jgi:hypothetical protein
MLGTDDIGPADGLDINYAAYFGVGDWALAGMVFGCLRAQRTLEMRGVEEEGRRMRIVEFGEE